ncbi:MAG: bifunctional UDP-3-O-[3-hydroxymyristoyl] N-acetylglucosamine deacetylase/3-hydroxyacyl-ACP dehydratase [Endomicrobiales bacterium]|nr:bifunctional UDP-3-O-[3-hydroxymyristoyl] N-acetylglucosamine deacetylase/3-hydroxyacyl-ACP dehydratase [Endomicrobiales bacterium]
MEKQKTIIKEVQLEGIGLHTGNITKAIFKPAPPDSGIKFIRMDIENKPVISASHHQVLGAIRGTTIGTDSVRVHTVEHLLAVFFGLGIDNLEIQLFNNEPPVIDGSAKPYVDLILKAGIQEQDAPKKYLTLSQPFVYEAENVKIEAYPSDELKIDCTVSYNHPFLSEQKASFVVNSDTFINEIAPARTFCFDYEIEALKKRGLAKGGDLTNAIVIGLKEIHNPDKKLRFKDEFVRHKILDLIGDLYLIGHPIKAHIVASRPGHSHNINFAKKLAALEEKNIHKKSKETKAMSTTQVIAGTTLDINAIQKIIPHRYPFLLIDKVTIVEELKRAVGYKCVSGNEHFFQGHFPGQPIMPGVLIIEAMAQTSCVLFLTRPDLKDKLAYFMAIDNVKFRKPVLPGDVLELKVEVLRARERGGRVRGEAYVNNNLVAESEFMFVIVDKE